MGNYNYAMLNTFRYYFRSKKTGQITCFDEYCYGNIYAQIQQFQKNLKDMCLLNISNETHTICKVVHLFNHQTIYDDTRKERWYV